MINKTIHYCWFGGGEKNALFEKCRKSWEKYAPDFEIREWNEESFNAEKYPYARFCLENKKYAFLSDFARLVIILENGGIYFDTDVELVKSPNELLKHSAFIGFETNDFVNTGQGFGAEKGHEAVAAMLEEYLKLEQMPNGGFELEGCPRVNTRALVQLGLVPNGKTQLVGTMQVLPADYLNPYDDPTGRLFKTENTVSVHWYGKSWMDRRTVLRSKLTKPLHRLQRRIRGK